MDIIVGDSQVKGTQHKYEQQSGEAVISSEQMSSRTR